MKDKLLKILPFILGLSIILSVLQYLNIHISTSVDYIISFFCLYSFSFGISLLIFCCLSRKSEGLSNIGIFLVFLSIFLSIIIFIFSKYISDFKNVKLILGFTKINSSLQHIISFFKYVGILFLIDSNDDSSDKARNVAIIFILLYEILSVIFVWKMFGITSVWFRIQKIVYNLFELSTVSFLVLRYFHSNDSVSNAVDIVPLDNGLVTPSIQANLNVNTQDTNGALSSIDLSNNQNVNSSTIINDTGNVSISSNINNVQSTDVSSNSNQPTGSLMSDFVLVDNTVSSVQSGVVPNSNVVSNQNTIPSNQNNVDVGSNLSNQ